MFNNYVVTVQKVSLMNRLLKTFRKITKKRYMAACIGRFVCIKNIGIKYDLIPNCTINYKKLKIYLKSFITILMEN